MIIITGPTASGKSTLGLQLAQRIGGAIIAADSRTVYKELSIGAGKVTTEYAAIRRESAVGPVYDIEGVPHYGIDLVTLDTTYTVAQYQEYVASVLPTIARAGRVPILLGGSGLYVDAVRLGYRFPEKVSVPQDWVNRTLSELVHELQRDDPKTAATIDIRNRRRVERALAYVQATGASFLTAQRRSAGHQHSLYVVDRLRTELYEGIDARVDARMASGMLEEVRALVAAGYEDRLLGLGLEYRILTQFLLGQIPSIDVAVRTLKYAIHGFARRQLSWWRSRPDAIWISSYTALEACVLQLSKGGGCARDGSVILRGGTRCDAGRC